MFTADDDDGGEGAFFDRAGLTRGLMVIVTAVAVGAFILAQGLDSSGDEVAAGTGEPSSPASGTEETTTTTINLATPASETTAGAGGGTEATDLSEAPVETTTTSTAPSGVLTGPGEVTVLVLNGAGTKGLAARGVAVLDEAGYETLAPTNATSLGPTQVLYAEGSEAGATGVAAVFEIDPAAVVSPLDVAAPPVGDTGNADVIVVIGSDGLIDL
jgi:hypothetical protein